MNHTVEIASVYNDAVKVKADEVKKGDYVFDVFGGTHEIERVTPFKHVVRITRDDGWPTTFGRDETITIIRGG